MKRKRKRIRIRRVLPLLVLVITIVVIFYNNTNSDTPKPAIAKDVPMPTELHPVVKERTNQLIQQAAKKGIVVVITDGFRSAKEQDSLYEQGRTADGAVVTHAKGGESYHNYGLAIDFALKTPSGDVVWDRDYDRNGNSKSDWTEVVQMAKKLGFEWGGDWAKFKDYPHLEMNFGLTIADLQNGERPDSSLVAGPNSGEQ